MHKQISILLFGLALIFTGATGQSFKQQFNDLVSKKDEAAQLELLKKWEAADSNDAELYVAYFNFYVNKSKKDFIELGSNPKGEDVLEIKNTDTTKNDPARYLYGNTSYDPALLKKGFEYADKGIEKNPSRLDIRFGKVYMYGETENYSDFTAEIIRTIDYSAIIKNKWTWEDNKPVDDPKGPKAFLLSSIQTYQIQLYNTENDSLLENMKQIANAILKYYPDHVESLSNIAVVYMIGKEYDKALEALLKAEKIAPRDVIVLNNIAQAYKRKGDRKNAIKYYELIMKYGDEEAIEGAKEQIKELKSK